MALRGAEALGVDDVWINDHLMGWTHPALWPDYPAAAVIPDPDAFLDPFVVAGALAQSTELRMGFCVTDTTRRRGPELARAGLTLNQICRGGFVLGVGAGEAESILPFGYEWDKPVGMLERALVELRSLLDTGEMPGDSVGRTGIDRDGEHGIPDIWVASMKPRSLKLTGRYAEGWMPIGTTPEAYEESFAIVNQAADEAGRPAPEASVLFPALFGESRDQVGRAARGAPRLQADLHVRAGRAVGPPRPRSPRGTGMPRPDGHHPARARPGEAARGGAEDPARAGRGLRHARQRRRGIRAHQGVPERRGEPLPAGGRHRHHLRARRGGSAHGRAAEAEGEAAGLQL